MPKDSRDVEVQRVIEQRDDSFSYMERNFYDDMEEVWKHYHCKVDPYKDIDGLEDKDKPHFGQPDTFAAVNRRTARITAQLPKISFTSFNGDDGLEERVSRKCMWDWDQGKIQRIQPLHVRQAELFGWSPRPWHWERMEHIRRKGINLAKESLSPEEIELIAKEYELEPMAKMILEGAPFGDPARNVIIASLMEKAGRRGLLDVSYLYKAFEGPRANFLFIGDCFPEPHFDEIQTSAYFIVEMRRDKQWLEDLANEWPEQFGDGIRQLFEKFPKGTSPGCRNEYAGTHLRDRLRRAIDQEDQLTSQYANNNKETGVWNILARWTPGREPKVTYVAEESILLGTIDSPYSLNGKIPFTELILCDSILRGIGDSASRIGKDLQMMRNLQANSRFQLFRHFSQPMFGTSDQTLFDNPEMMTRQAFRFVMMRRGPGSVWNLNDSPSMASAAATMNDEQGTQRSLQVLYGESNMSLAANVDPSQSRTATGARIMQANTDIITKALVDAFHMTSVNPDVEMIWLLNRSEMSDAVKFDARPYLRNYDTVNMESDPMKAVWIVAEAEDFQQDGNLVVEIGSTLADDDEAKVAQATNLFQMLSGNPLVNQETLVKNLLIAHNQGSKLQQYMVKPQPAQPEPIKASVSISLKGEDLSEAERRAALIEGGITSEEIAAAQAQVMQQAAAMQAPMPPAAPPEEELPPQLQ